jgi:hypothetical protein
MASGKKETAFDRMIGKTWRDSGEEEPVIETKSEYTRMKHYWFGNYNDEEKKLRIIKLKDRVREIDKQIKNYRDAGFKYNNNAKLKELEDKKLDINTEIFQLNNHKKGSLGGSIRKSKKHRKKTKTYQKKSKKSKKTVSKKKR